ncbi:hypothetical protein P9112_012965 [Eukaryota sp. TZLM1-RC]
MNLGSLSDVDEPHPSPTVSSQNAPLSPRSTELTRLLEDTLIQSRSLLSSFEPSNLYPLSVLLDILNDILDPVVSSLSSSIVSNIISLSSIPPALFPFSPILRGCIPSSLTPANHSVTFHHINTISTSPLVTLLQQAESSLYTLTNDGNLNRYHNDHLLDSQKLSRVGLGKKSMQVKPIRSNKKIKNKNLQFFESLPQLIFSESGVNVVDFSKLASDDFGRFLSCECFSYNRYLICFSKKILFANDHNVLEALPSIIQSKKSSRHASLISSLTSPINCLFLNCSIVEQVMEGISFTLTLTLCRNQTDGRLSIAVYFRDEVILVQPLDCTLPSLTNFESFSWEQSERINSLNNFRVFSTEMCDEFTKVTLINDSSKLLTKLNISSKDYKSLVFKNGIPAENDLLSLHKTTLMKKLNPYLFPYARKITLSTQEITYLTSLSLINGDLIVVYLIDPKTLLVRMFSLVQNSVQFHDVKVSLVTWFYNYPLIKLYYLPFVNETNSDYLFVFHNWVIYGVSLGLLTVVSTVSLIETETARDCQSINIVDSFKPQFSSIPIISISHDFILSISALNYDKILLFKLKLNGSCSSFRARFISPFHRISLDNNSKILESHCSNILNRNPECPWFVNQIVQDIIENSLTSSIEDCFCGDDFDFDQGNSKNVFTEFEQKLINSFSFS